MEIYGGEWVGVIGRVATCQGCHNDTYAPDMFTRWLGTRHATMFERGINGLVSDDYQAECISCHTVGYSPLVDNNGFDDVAADNDWSFPEALAAGNWEALLGTNPGVARLANVQCESCHGPQDSTAHMAGFRGRFGTGMCGRCHDSGSHTVKPYEWEFSAHAHLRLAMDNASVEARGPTTGDCARCHAAQGYVRYSASLAAGVTGPLEGDVELFHSIGLGRDTVEPVTCAACHEPHGTPNPHQLRFYDSIDSLPAGFGVSGAGSGAICTGCHNSRLGLHDDEHPPRDYVGLSLPAQADVLWGRNAYFMGHVRSSSTNHLALEDTCATCHMAETGAGEIPTEGGHTWQVGHDLCARCHGEGVRGHGIEAEVEEDLGIIDEEIGAALVRLLEGEVAAGHSYSVRAWNPTTGCFSSTAEGPASDVVIASAPGTAVPVLIGEQWGFAITLPTPVRVTWTSFGCSGSSLESTVYFQLASLVPRTGAAPLVPPGDVIVRALWNAELVRGDGSGGIHNPGWIFEVLANTTEAIGRR